MLSSERVDACNLVSLALRHKFTISIHQFVTLSSPGIILRGRCFLLY